MTPEVAKILAEAIVGVASLAVTAFVIWLMVRY